MTLLNVERIKLTSTRSPWWCAAVTVVLSVGFASLIGYGSTQTGPDGQRIALSVTDTQIGATQLGLAVVMIMATLAVTTEYRFGVVRTTFQATPNRTAVLLAKAGLLALVAAVIAEVVAFASFFLAAAISRRALTLSSAADWRAVAGLGLVYALAAILAVAVGSLLRQSAGAIAVLLLFPLAVENLTQLIPKVGDDLYSWMPFVNANRFLGQLKLGDTLGPWGSLGYFALVVAVLTVIAVVVVNRRDA
ncbi:MAG: hypothetical protein ABI181_13435 [Mycobacteriaceae bacterium]